MSIRIYITESIILLQTKLLLYPELCLNTRKQKQNVPDLDDDRNDSDMDDGKYDVDFPTDDKPAQIIGKKNKYCIVMFFFLSKRIKSERIYIIIGGRMIALPGDSYPTIEIRSVVILNRNNLLIRF